MPIRKANARWNGTLTDGNGTIRLPAADVEARYSFQSRFQEGSGTNPEELLGAAHAGCFSMAFAGNLTRAGYAPESVETEAQVHLEKAGDGFEIPRIHLVTKVKVAGVSDSDFQRIAEDTKKGCPISRVLEKAEITMDAQRL